MSKRRITVFRICTLLLFASLLSGSGCGSPEPKKTEPQVPAYVPPPPPPIEDILQEARDAEKVGEATSSFTCLYGFEEAIRAYQRLADHYPKSEEAREATAKVKKLAKRVREIRSWKSSIEEARKDFNMRENHPSQMHPVFTAVMKMRDEAPEGFIREGVNGLLETISKSYKEKALAEVAEAGAKVIEARTRGDLREGLNAIRALPGTYSQDLPEVAQEIEKHRQGLEKDASDRAERQLERARLAVRRSQNRRAMTILHEAWKKFRGFQVALEILAKERNAALAGLKALASEAMGRTREIDRMLFQYMEAHFRLDPDGPEGRQKTREYADGFEAFLDKYRASIEEMTSTQREFQVRKTYLEKLVRWEEERIK